MIVDTEKRALGVFSTQREMEDALNELQSLGFSMNQISVIGKGMSDLHQSASTSDVRMQDVSEATQVDEGAKTGAITGGTLGGLTGLLVGLGTLAIPGVGPVMLAGAAATALATAATGSVVGAAAGGLVGALIGLGIPEDQAEVYNGYIAQGDYLIIVDGTDSEIRRAETVLRRRSVREWSIYNRNTTYPPLM
jgi:hypothetical protein